MCVSSNFPKDKSDPTSHFCSYKLLQSSHDPLIKTENLTNMTFRIIYYLVLAYFFRLTFCSYTWVTPKDTSSLLLLLLNCVSCVQLCATPQTAAHQAPPHPWDSPGKNTGVVCHFLLQCIKVKSESEVSQSCPTLSDPMDCSLPSSSVHGIFQAWVLE